MQKEIGALPAGTYENSMVVDGFDRPITIAARITISGDVLEIDFEGTSAISAYGINVPLTYTQAYTSFGVRCVVGASIPNNSGSLATISVHAPVGSILNAPRPCAVAIRHVVGSRLSRQGDTRTRPRRGEFQPLEPHVVSGPRFGGGSGIRKSYAVFGDYLSFGRHRGPAFERRPIRDCLPVGGAQYAGGDHRNPRPAHI